MSRLPACAILGLALALPAMPAHADGGPVIVIPTRPGIPVIINGYDASYAVVEGDWGLARPGAGVVTVIGGAPVRPSEVYTRRHSYHPKYGWAPERGRNEVEPPPDRALPDQAEPFSRSWSNQGEIRPTTADEKSDARHPVYPDAVPATLNDPQAMSPPLVVVPRPRRP